MSEPQTPKFAELYRDDFDDKYPSYTSEAISKLVSDIQNKKEALIKSRLEELGLSKLLENIESRRFKRLMREVTTDTGEETWWADDETETGMRVITFRKQEVKTDFEKDIYKMGFELKYY